MPSDLNKITHPLLYEINTWPWLEAISRNEGNSYRSWIGSRSLLG